MPQDFASVLESRSVLEGAVAQVFERDALKQAGYKIEPTWRLAPDLVVRLLYGKRHVVWRQF
jgi:hypothetical protein